MSADTVSPPDAARPGPLWAFMYHSVAEITGPADDPYQVTVTPGRLERQLRWLRRRGLTGVSMDELLRARAAGRGARLVGLTFDDGYADFVEHAVPLLRRHGCTATLFVLPGRLGGTNEWDPLGPRKPLLTEDGIRAAADAGMEIGSHGLLHTDLTTADNEHLAQDTAHSRALLRAMTGREVAGYCYPYGTVDARAVAAVRAAGYGYACAISPGPLTGVLALPRIHVGEGDTGARLLLKQLLHRRRREPVPETAYAEYAAYVAERGTAAPDTAAPDTAAPDTAVPS
ncbi:polysaccharide deacetylase family protein [Streptomyces sp. NPDC093109]|uniref:polysaccharide deacetylase family protein n=1 Tax=Streptomyces sp. NPDC093109 TaxID=3154977 RepID=UPI00344E4AC9